MTRQTVNITMPRAADLNILAPSLVIVTGNSMDEERHKSATLEDMHRYYDDKATEFVTAMRNSLPQGLTDRILAQLMAAKVMDFIYSPKEMAKQ